MFVEDNSLIRDYAWSGTDEMYRTLVFVRMTIQRHLERVRPLVDMVMADGPECLAMAVERRSVTELRGLAEFFINNDMSHTMPPGDIMRHSVRVYGIGIPKAGFITQLLTGHVGCLDTHNLKLYDVKDTFRTGGSWASVEAKISTYMVLCKHVGGSKHLWDSWCNHVAAIRPNVWENGNHVSRYHVETICGL